LDLIWILDPDVWIFALGVSAPSSSIASRHRQRHSPGVTSGTSIFKALLGGALLTLVAGIGTGCGTWMNHRVGDCHVYGGVKRDWRDLKAQATPEAVAIVTALDLPLSAIGDTLCLPYDLAKDKE
jgi:uncharacterized protein YceK